MFGLVLPSVRQGGHKEPGLILSSCFNSCCSIKTDWRRLIYSLSQVRTELHVLRRCLWLHHHTLLFTCLIVFPVLTGCPWWWPVCSPTCQSRCLHCCYLPQRNLRFPQILMMQHCQSPTDLRFTPSQPAASSFPEPGPSAPCSLVSDHVVSPTADQAGRPLRASRNILMPPKVQRLLRLINCVQFSNPKWFLNECLLD